MSPVQLAKSQTDSREQAVADAIVELVELVRSGRTMDAEEWLCRFPDCEEQLRQLFPTMQVLADLAEASSLAGPRATGSSTADTVTGQLGDFRILRELGRGGMGIVYEAEQISLGRRVALKVLPFAAVLDKKQLQRFHNEARAAATLNHPGIVDIHSVGCERGVHYYAMQFIHGKTLAELIHELRVGGSLRAPPDPALDAVLATPPKPPTDRSPALPGDLRSGKWLGQETGHSARESGSLGAGLPTPPKLPTDRSPALPGDLRSDKWLGQETGHSARESGDQPTTGYPATPAHPAPPSAETPRNAQVFISTEGSTHSPEFFRTVANLGIQAAEALDHAHAHGIVHRDIKPGNLMLDEEGHLWITDFGLARIEADPGLTMTGDILGTLRYMSPEQALAKRVVVDHRADIYSLGVTFYELLTLQPAVHGDDREEILKEIAFFEPRLPRRVNKSIPLDLETVVLKAMRKNPDERYDTAQELADDLKRFTEDKPIRARRPTLRQRTVKWSRRHRPLVAALALLLVALTVASLVSTAIVLREQRRTEEAFRESQQQRRAAQRNADLAQRAAAESKAVADFLVNDLIGAAEPESKKGKDVTVDEVLVRAEEKIATAFQDQPLMEAAIRHTIGKAFAELGQFEKAKQHWSQSRKIRMGLLGAEHPDTLASMHELANLLEDLGDYENARKLHEETLALQRRALGPEHPDTIRSISGLAWTLFRLNELAKAQKLSEEALELSRRINGPEYRDTLGLMHVLATALSAQDELQKARKLFEETLELRRRFLGPENPRTLETMDNLANVYDSLRELEKARKLHEETLELGRRGSVENLYE